MDVQQAIEECRIVPERLRALDPQLFEAVVAELLAGFGWEVSVTAMTRDGGYDILGVSTDASGLKTSWIVECKRYGLDNKVGVQIARQIVGVKSHIGVPNAVLATTSSFTADAHELSSARHDLSLVDFATLSQWLERYSQPTAGASHTAQRSFSSCFISHSSKDSDFAQKLAARLRMEGVPVWYAPDDILPGEKIYEQVKKAIASFDRLLVVLSRHSMDSEWVKTEMANALARERTEGRRVLFPVSLVQIELIRGWEFLDSDTGVDIAKELRSYHIADFSDWSNPVLFEQQVAKVVQALKGSDPKTSESQDKSAEQPKEPSPILRKRLAATENLWSAVLDLRDRLSPVVFFYTILVPSEYDTVFEPNSKTRDMVAPITDELVGEAMRHADRVEVGRPYLGDALWSQFFVYRAFLGRLAALIVLGKRRRHIGEWREDSGIRQILGALFEKGQLDGLLGSKDNLNAIYHVLDRLQNLMLNEISHICAGQENTK
jgi:hypothetical protein